MLLGPLASRIPRARTVVRRREARLRAEGGDGGAEGAGGGFEEERHVCDICVELRRRKCVDVCERVQLL